jgi:hypothetical protein
MNTTASWPARRSGRCAVGERSAIEWTTSPIPSVIVLPGEWPFPWLPEGAISSWRRGVWVAERPLDWWERRRRLRFPTPDGKQEDLR